MTVPARLTEMPTQRDIEVSLARLCTHALRTYWILEPEGWDLLGLDCVREHLVDDADETEYANALRRYLETAVQRVASPAYRTILEVVLGLGQGQWKSKEWRHKKASERRAEAGRLFEQKRAL